jgi:hypothetical protein
MEIRKRIEDEIRRERERDRNKKIEMDMDEEDKVKEIKRDNFEEEMRFDSRYV